MTTYEQLSRCFWSWLTKKIRMWSTPPALNSSSWINKSKRSIWQVHQSIGSWVTQRWRLGKWHGCSWKGRVKGWKDVETLPAAWFKPSGFWRINTPPRIEWIEIFFFVLLVQRILGPKVGMNDLPWFTCIFESSLIPPKPPRRQRSSCCGVVWKRWTYFFEMGEIRCKPAGVDRAEITR